MNPTPQDRELLEFIYGGSFKFKPKREREVLQAITTARLQGRREALEEAARVADRHDTGDCTREDMEARRIAADIRKLGEA